MAKSLALLITMMVLVSAAEKNAGSPPYTASEVQQSVHTSPVNSSAIIPASVAMVSSDTHTESRSSEIPSFLPEIPHELLKIESEEARPRNRARVLVIDGTQYGQSEEHVVPRNERSKHFLRQSELSAEKQVFDDFGVSKDIDDFIASAQSAAEAFPTHPVVKELSANVDSWAQETRAGFAGYLEKLGSVWEKESVSVGKKLFEAADAYSHRFFSLVRVKESEHPVLAAKVTRIIVAMGLSLTLVFLIFGIALHLQKSIVARAHEEASKQQPVSRLDREQIFFAMPYQHAPTRSIAVIE
jgi:hypothetical protein